MRNDRTTRDPLISLEQVAKVFPPPVSGTAPIRLFHGLDLAVSPGELVLVEGVSGSGKTTLLGMAGLLLRPDTGRVRFMGRDAGADSEGRRNLLRRQHLGFVFQDSQLFERMTAWESIALPLRIRGAATNSCRRRAVDLLDALGLAGRAEQRTEQLSGGEQQRVAVARALAASPDLVIADEPLSGADPASAGLIAELLADARGTGVGLLVASHHPLFRDSADRRIELGEKR